MSKNNHEQPVYSRDNYENKQNEIISLDQQATQTAVEVDAQYAEKLDVFEQLRQEDGEAMQDDSELINEERELLNQRNAAKEELLSPLNKEITRAKAELGKLYVKSWNEATREESRREHVKALEEVKMIHTHILESYNKVETSYHRIQGMITDADRTAITLEELLADPRRTSEHDEEEIKELVQKLLEINKLIDEEICRLHGHRIGECKDDLN